MNPKNSDAVRVADSSDDDGSNMFRRQVARLADAAKIPNNCIQFDDRGRLRNLGYRGENNPGYVKLLGDCVRIAENYYNKITSIDLKQRLSLYDFRQVVSWYFVCIFFGIVVGIAFMRATSTMDCGELNRSFMDLTYDHANLKVELRHFRDMAESYKKQYEELSTEYNRFKVNYG